MTAPADDKLYVNDTELIAKLGIPEKRARAILRELDRRPTGFPRKQKLLGDRRYWPAVQAYLDRNNGVILGGDAARSAAENRAPHPAAASPSNVRALQRRGT